jgi:hypothetical protein
MCAKLESTPLPFIPASHAVRAIQSAGHRQILWLMYQTVIHHSGSWPMALSVRLRARVSAVNTLRFRR